MKRSLSTLSTISGLLLAVGLLSFSSVSLKAAEDGIITIELNKTENTEQGCRPLFLFDNQSGHQLSKFQVELVLFDDKGVYARQILLDMAPLYQDKKVVASFLLADLACDQIGSMLVNALPSCANSDGNDLDCLALLEVNSRGAIPLEK